MECQICGKGTDIGVFVNGFFCCDEECANVANEPDNFDLIQKAIKTGYNIL